MIDHIGDDDRLHRSWTPGRVIGWLLVLAGALVQWFFWVPGHITYVQELGAFTWWSGAWVLFWSWIAWRRRRRIHEKAEIQARHLSRWSRG